ncbi:MarR family winged helix-turn-helix transcriptional regulator [Phytopseudomonas dryadis]|uniref:MarR family transcriptional regulator n=1 Tax=Phytopseudomonas dryadis TaxID=2487520 RepID=A0A4Q9QXZ5_9GAMM|nr:MULTISPECIES: MarR family transcriptional regulator [Pseudomonas]TBU88787.1 MarR family transcriptional regulator [Pseudomonas dryadis]TBV00665.1 MarR family transcriptional regulator [Pseudomonas dryadis]TBV13139.1 MarR family transcriptional regulator [Pseudomonas sp. FRB 230]
MPHFDRERFSLQHSPGHLIALINQLKDRLLERHLVDHGVTAAQFKVVLLISQGRASTPADLVRLLSLDSGAMTRMLDRLEQKALITRERSSEDRRQVRLALTESGHALGVRVPQIAADATNDLTGCLSRAELHELERLLKKMLMAADALPHEPGE